ncbi:hypothetical protein Sjap_026100 [Stephania japonica]|uniref:Uncharacterized protein n=1 Tax=Stephania japonica TaxID=461633 RepID=A0AAP0EAS4_9MAGN
MYILTSEFDLLLLVQEIAQGPSSIFFHGFSQMKTTAATCVVCGVSTLALIVSGTKGIDIFLEWDVSIVKFKLIAHVGKMVENHTE